MSNNSSALLSFPYFTSTFPIRVMVGTSTGERITDLVNLSSISEYLRNSVEKVSCGYLDANNRSSDDWPDFMARLKSTSRCFEACSCVSIMLLHFRIITSALASDGLCVKSSSQFCIATAYSLALYALLAFCHKVAQILASVNPAFTDLLSFDDMAKAARYSSTAVL